MGSRTTTAYFVLRSEHLFFFHPVQCVSAGLFAKCKQEFNRKFLCCISAYFFDLPNHFCSNGKRCGINYEPVNLLGATLPNGPWFMGQKTPEADAALEMENQVELCGYILPLPHLEKSLKRFVWEGRQEKPPAILKVLEEQKSDSLGKLLVRIPRKNPLFNKKILFKQT